ncbi:MAG: alanyl-tRNA editing protein [Bacillota bacterium]|nr:alanyl-tRNA editing protein [Bacillota bacterium]
MKMTKLYQQDVYIKEWETTISRIEKDTVYLTESAFFPEGGGQSCDVGYICSSDGRLRARVTDVQEDGEDVAHTIAIADAPEGAAFSAGDAVKCGIDWDRRFDNMQRHCGEHILSGIFYQECGGVNRGFHMGEDYMTIDISLEDEPTNPDRTRPSVIDMQLALHCEQLANQVIWSNAPVIVMRFDSREEAEKLPLRKKLAFDEDISIVCVGSPENAADCVACCGTHPSTAGQVGLIKIYKVEKYKEMFRIYFEAGERALKDYDLKHDMLTDLANRYSSSIDDFPKKIHAQEEHLASVKNELFQLKKAFTEIESARLDQMIAETDENVVVCPLEHFSVDDAFNMAKSYMGSDRTGGKLLLLYSVPAASYVLVSDGSIKCGQLVREYANFYQGKGGGNDVSARAMFASDENAGLFAELLKNHLR